MFRLREIVLVLWVSAWGLGTAFGSDETPEIAWANHSHTMELSSGQIRGPAVDWIRRAATNCQFVLFGEQHGVAQLPQVVSAIYTELHPEGFESFIMERGPWVARQLSDLGVSETLQKFPHAVAFDYDGEVQLLKNVESLSGDRDNVFWGVDQSLTAIHGLHRLSKILPTHSSRRAANGLFLKDALQGGRFLSQDHSLDFKMLRRLAGSGLGEEAKLILDALEKSQSIFVAYHNKERDARGIYASDSIREQYMMDQIDHYISESARSGQPRPKCIVKMGGAHIMEGIGPNGVRTLGDHIQKAADANGLDALHIAIRSHSQDSGWPAQAFADSSLVLIDTRSLRALLPESAVTRDFAKLARDIWQYDAVILMKDAVSDTSVELKGYEGDFKRGLLSSLAVLLIPVLTTISLAVPFGRKLWGRKKKPELLTPFQPWLIVGLLSAVLFAAIVFQVLRIRRWQAPELSGLNHAPWMLGLEFLCVLMPLSLSVMMLKKTWWSGTQRLHFGLASVGLAGLAVFSHWWNLGRMLG
ncbi:MAG: hypothetical protein AAFU85_27250 [Planctomycetota bacterium]